MHHKALRLWALGLILAGCGGMATADPGCAGLPEIEEIRVEHLGKLNAIRVREDKSRLIGDTTLDRIAQDYACLLARTGHFDHTGPDGSTPGTRAEAGGYRYCRLAENLAKGYMSIDTVLAGWVRSPGHLRNIRMDGVDEIGFGVAYAAEGAEPAPAGPGSLSALAETLDGKPRSKVLPRRNYVWVQVFGRPC